MTRSLAASGVAAFVGAGLLSLAGCNRAPEPAAGSPESTATTAPEPAALPATDGSAPIDAPATRTPAPGEPLQAYVWNCDDGQTVRMRNLLRENAVTIERHEGGRKLPQVPSASGAKYSDGSLTFWTRGDTALFERQGSAPVNCRQDRFESLLADARVRGVAYRGTGNEPGWTLEIGPAARLEFVTGYGEERHAFDGAAEVVEGSSRAYTASSGEKAIRVTITAEACTDDMSGWAFDHRMVVESGGQTYRGCATALR